MTWIEILMLVLKVLTILREQGVLDDLSHKQVSQIVEDIYTSSKNKEIIERAKNNNRA